MGGKEAIVPVLKEIDNAVAKNKYLLGDKITLIDFMTVTELDTLSAASVKIGYQKVGGCFDDFRISPSTSRECMRRGATPAATTACSRLCRLWGRHTPTLPNPLCIFSSNERY